MDYSYESIKTHLQFSSHTFAVTNILLAQWLGSLVDRIPKLQLVRGCVVAQKLSAFTAYGIFIMVFYWTGIKQAPTLNVPALGLIIIAGAVLQASNTCVTIAVERDWVICIAGGSSDRLSSLNARLKRIDLLCKLLAPLFVSTLSTFLPYPRAAGIMAVMQPLSLTAELFWLGIVYQSCPALARDQARKDSRQPMSREDEEDRSPGVTSCALGVNCCSSSRGNGYWSEFTKLPVFLSSLSASFLYMTVLS